MEANNIELITRMVIQAINQNEKKNPMALWFQSEFQQDTFT